MTEMISDSPAARTLPARHHFALARLIAFLMHRFGPAPQMDVDHLLLPIDQYQSAVENYTVAVWFWLTAAGYLAAVLPLHPVLALVIAIPLAPFVLQIPLYLGATPLVLMTLYFSATVYFATAAGPIHYVAWFALAVFATNAIAWIINRVCGI